MPNAGAWQTDHAHAIVGRAEHWEQGLAGDDRRPRLVVEIGRQAAVARAAAFSPDGHIIAGSVGQDIVLWSACGILKVRFLHGHTHEVTSIAFSPDGRLLASASGDSTVRLWDVETGALLRSFVGHEGWVLGVAFSPTQPLVASCGQDKTIRLWAVPLGEQALAALAHDAWVTDVAFSPDGRTLASSAGDGVWLWDAEKMALQRILTEKKGRVAVVAFSPDGSAIVAGGANSALSLWQLDTQEATQLLTVSFPSTTGDTSEGRAPDPTDSLSWSPDGETIASGSAQGKVTLWDVRSRGLRRTFERHLDRVWSIAFSPDSTRMVSGGYNCTLKLWDIAGHEELASLIAIADDVWAVVTPGDLYDAPPRASEYMHWVLGSGAPIVLDQLEAAYHDENLLAKLMGLDSTPLRETSSRPRADLATCATTVPSRRASVAQAERQKPELMIRTKPAHEVYSLALSLDGKYLAAGGSDMNIDIWDTVSGVEVRTLRGHRHTITSLAFRADGLLASGSKDGTARLWDSQSGRLIHTFFVGLQGYSVSVAFCGDKASEGLDGALMCISDCGMIAFCHADSARTLHTTRIRQVDRNGRDFILNTPTAVGPDGRVAIRPHDRGAVSVLDLWAGKTLHTKTIHSDTPGALAFNPDGAYFATGGATSQGLVVIGRSNSKESGFPPETYAIKLFATKIGLLLQTLEGHTANVTSLTFSHSGQLMASGSADGSIKLWDWQRGECIRTLQTGSDIVRSLCFDNEDHILVSGEGSTRSAGRITLWDVETGDKRRTLERPIGDIHPVVFYDDDRSLAVAGEDGIIYCWSLDRRDGPRVLRGHTNRVFSLAISPDGRKLASGSWDGATRLWEPNSGEELQRIEHPPAWCVVFTPDSAQVITACADGTLHVCNVAADRLHRVFGTPARAVTPPGVSGFIAVSVSRNGRTLAGGTADGVIVLLDMKTGEQIRSFQAHEGYVSRLCFSPNDELLASGGRDQAIKFWDAVTGELRASFRGHEIPGLLEKGTSIAFDPGGRLLASGGADRTIRLWDIATGRQLAMYEGHSGSIASVQFNAAGKLLATGSNDASTILLDVSDPTAPKELCTLYSFPDGSWAVVDSQGRYDASNAGEIQWLHWVVGLEPVSLSQLKERYYEPGLLSKLCGYSDEPLRDVPTLDQVALYPEANLVVSDPSDPKARLFLTNRGGGIGRVVVSINGKEVPADVRGSGFDPQAGAVELQIDVSDHPYLIPGESNTCTIRVYNAEGYLVSRDLTRAYHAPRRGTLEPPHFWAVVVGTSDYQGEIRRLSFAAKDAEDIAVALQLGADRLFGADRVHIALLAAHSASTTEQLLAHSVAAPVSSAGTMARLRATRANITEAFQRAQQAKSTDILLVYLAGHGINYGGQDGDYYYLTTDARTGNLADPAIREQTALSSRELVEFIQQIPALKQVLILDTCAAGRFVENVAKRRAISSSQIRALERMKDRMGMHILSASTSDAVSYESSRYGQGLLTYSLLLGMRGAALREDEFVDVSTLFKFAEDQVPELAKGIGGIQLPIPATPYGGGSFDIGRVTETDRVQIPLAKAHPVVVRASFQDEARYRDTVGLSQAVNEVLRDRSAMGREAPLVFIDAEKFPDAFELVGRYRLEDARIRAQLRLFRDDKDVGSFDVEGRQPDLAQLSSDIVTALLQRIRNAS